MALPHGAVSWSIVCDCGTPDHTHDVLIHIPLSKHMRIRNRFTVPEFQRKLRRKVTMKKGERLSISFVNEKSRLFVL